VIAAAAAGSVCSGAVPLNPVTELEALVDALDVAAVPYALCGGLALGVHGHPRATEDIDLLVQPGDLERALAVAKRIGFDVPARKMIFGLRTGKHREIQRVSKLDPDTGDLMALDFLVVNEELADVWSDRLTVETGVRRLSVVSRSGLAKMKRIAGRGQDLVDLAKLEGTYEDDE
jgi:hypothetical protein